MNYYINYQLARARQEELLRQAGHRTPRRPGGSEHDLWAARSALLPADRSQVRRPGLGARLLRALSGASRPTNSEVATRAASVG